MTQEELANHDCHKDGESGCTCDTINWQGIKEEEIAEDMADYEF